MNQVMYRATDYGHSDFFAAQIEILILKKRGTFGQFVSTHFGTVSPLSTFSNNQPLFLQKN